MSQRGNRSSLPGSSDARTAKEGFDRKVHELVQYYVMRMRSSCGVIKRADIVKDVLGEEFSKDFLEINQSAAKCLRDIFGIEVRDSDLLENKATGNKNFMLSSKLLVPSEDVALRLDYGSPNALTNEKRGLLKFILCVIRAYGGETSEANLARALKHIGVLYMRNEEHPRFGDVKKLFDEFRKAGYIDAPNGALTGNSDGTHLIRFGLRARLEFDDRINKELFDVLNIRAELRITE